MIIYIYIYIYIYICLSIYIYIYIYIYMAARAVIGDTAVAGPSGPAVAGQSWPAVRARSSQRHIIHSAHGRVAAGCPPPPLGLKRMGLRQLRLT